MPGSIGLLEGFGRSGDKRGGEKECMVRGVVGGWIGWMREMRHTRVFESEDEVDGYLWSVEFGCHARERIFVGCVGEVEGGESGVLFSRSVRARSGIGWVAVLWGGFGNGFWLTLYQSRLKTSNIEFVSSSREGCCPCCCDCTGCWQ